MCVRGLVVLGSTRLLQKPTVPHGASLSLASHAWARDTHAAAGGIAVASAKAKPQVRPLRGAGRCWLILKHSIYRVMKFASWSTTLQHRMLKWVLSSESGASGDQRYWMQAIKAGLVKHREPFKTSVSLLRQTYVTHS